MISPDVSSAWVKVWKESDRDAPGNGEVLGILEQKILKKEKEVLNLIEFEPHLSFLHHENTPCIACF